MLTTDASTEFLRNIYCMVWINNMVYPQLYNVLSYDVSVRALVYMDDIKHFQAGYKTSPTMWSLCSGPIQSEIL
jgi:hypothetical protein